MAVGCFCVEINNRIPKKKFFSIILIFYRIVIKTHYCVSVSFGEESSAGAILARPIHIIRLRFITEEFEVVNQTLPQLPRQITKRRSRINEGQIVLAASCDRVVINGHSGEFELVIC